MEKINWTFYYKTNDGQIHIVGTGNYKKPGRTKHMDTLDNLLSQDNIKGVGYCQTEKFEGYRELL